MKTALALAASLIGGLFAIVSIERPSEPELVAMVATEPRQDGPGVVPVEDVTPVAETQLDRIESKLDQVLKTTSDTNNKFNNLIESNKQNTQSIVDAIKGIGQLSVPPSTIPCPCPGNCPCPDGVCPACPTEPPKPELTKPATKVKYRSVLSPRWRINGKVWTRSEIISHLLNHPNHSAKFSRSQLEGMTLGQLWWIHDQDHDQMSSRDVIPVDPAPIGGGPGNGCPGGVCPSGPVRGMWRSRPKVFPNAWWNR